jgi:adenylosuccinate synthase
MANTVLIGSQWGDEGKGKVIDILSRDAEWIVRYQGGNNAGHTVEIGEEKYVLHLLPSGVLTEGKRCVIGNGLVVDPMALAEEMKGLLERGISLEGRLFISDRAHVVLPFHRLIDVAREQRKADADKIGTTKRGIGPCYGDKAARVGLRMGDLVDPEFPRLLSARMEEQNAMLDALGSARMNEAAVLRAYEEVTAFLAPYITDTVPLLNEAVKRGEDVLFEGAQGTMLDIDYGTYPFVTSSNSTAGGACTGTGVPPQRIDKVLGVIKAYTTRVGEGPFPTELLDAEGEKMREVGGEFGATTGRPRRCGWFDAVVARHAAMINGINTWAVTKLDVLDHFETLQICVAYACDGKRLEYVPANVRILERCKPIYESFEGWKASTCDARTLDDLPERARAYVARLEELSGAPVEILSVGPRRDSTICVGDASS